MVRTKQQFFVEVTDTFGGEANYSWVNRFLVNAETERGAISKVSRREGYRLRNVGDGAYHGRGACIIAFITEADGKEQEHFHHIVAL